MSQKETSKSKTINSSDNSEIVMECQAKDKQHSQVRKTPNHRDKTGNKECLQITTDIDKIFERRNPNLSDILHVLKEIFHSQQFLSTQYDEFLLNYKHLEETCDSLKKENSKLKKELKEVQNRVENMEYISREKNLEIQGIPEEDEENLNKTIINIANLLDMELLEEEIDYIYRIKNTRKEPSNKPAPIIVSFKKKDTKEKLLFSRKRRSIYSKEIGFKKSRSQVYINEHLTKRSKELFWEARKLKKEHNFKYAWYKHGSIYVKRNDNTNTIKISDESDILKLQH